MIYTLNEEIHLPACLESLSWCDDIIVIDSFSDDATEDICKQKGIRFFQNKFTGFGDQRNWSLENCDPKYDWVLILDADEKVPENLANELQSLAANSSEMVGAYRIRRRFYMWGRWLKYSSLYPTWVVRFIHKDRVRYENRGHAETQIVEGEIKECSHDLIDENLKGIDEWFDRQNRYSSKDAEFELQHAAQYRVKDVLDSDPLVRRAGMKYVFTRFPGRPAIYFMYSYFFKLGFLDGKAGLVFCLMKSLYQQTVNIKKYDIQQRK